MCYRCSSKDRGVLERQPQHDGIDGMPRLKIIPELMPNATLCQGKQLGAVAFREGPTALRLPVRTDCVPNWFALIGMLKGYGRHVRRYQFLGSQDVSGVLTLCLDFEPGYRDRANQNHDSLFHAASDLHAGPLN
jgi:hypothetical protein